MMIDTLKIGDGVTFAIGSDRVACTVVGFSASRKTVKFQRDVAKIVSGTIYDYPVYEYAPDTNAPIWSARWNEKLQSYVVSHFGRKLGNGRHEHYDPHF